MLFNSKEKFLENGVKSLAEMYDEFSALNTISLSSLNPEETVLIVIDVINGFLKEGAMADTCIATIVTYIEEIMGVCRKLRIPIAAFADSHIEEAEEFEYFPPHCIKGSYEAKLIDELSEFGKYDRFVIFEKNSTNGYLEEEFQKSIETHPNLKTCIVVGDCTDICVLQFCQTLKADFNRLNKACEVIVPLSAVETYNSAGHDSDFMNFISLKLMQNMGITLVKGIEE